MTAITINLKNIVKLSDDQFYQLCQDNPEVKFERNGNGELIVMPPTGGETGKRNAKLTARFVFWNEQTQLGEVFDSSTCFKLLSSALLLTNLLIFSKYSSSSFPASFDIVAVSLVSTLYMASPATLSEFLSRLTIECILLM